MSPTSIPEHFGPAQRDAIRHFHLARAWSATAVEGLHVRGRHVDSEGTLIDTLRTIDATDLAVLTEDLRAACQRADEERERLRSHEATCNGCQICDPAGEHGREAAAAAQRAAEFRASPAGRAERTIALLEEISAKLSGGAR